MSFFARKKAPVAAPRFVELSANNFCNLRCAFCYGAGKPAPQELSSEEHQRLLDALLPGADVVIPSAGSEPFLGDLERTLEAVQQYNNRLLLITSGYYLTEEWTRRLAPHLYRLQISLDSHRKDGYERLRTGSDYERVVENLKTAARILRGKNLAHRLVVSAVATSENFAHLPELIEIAAGWGVEVFLIQQLYGAEGKFEHLSLTSKFSVNEIEKMREEMIVAAERARVDLMIAATPVQHRSFRPSDAPPVEWDPEYTLSYLRAHPGGCYQAAQWAKIVPDGTVYPCCVAPPELAMGNVRERPVEKILSDPKWRRLRAALESGAPPEVCRGCELRKQYGSYSEES